jgi:uncharacterized protein
VFKYFLAIDVRLKGAVRAGGNELGSEEKSRLSHRGFYRQELALVSFSLKNTNPQSEKIYMDATSIIDPAIYDFVKEWMMLGDPSHDFEHILRVYKNAMKILDAEQQANPERKWDTKLIVYAAYLHDIGDRKYFPKLENRDETNSKYLAILDRYGLRDATSVNVVSRLLKESHGEEFAEKVQLLCTHVSWSLERKDPSKTQDVIEKCPELAVIQDADRLDAIGAVGIARVFTYTAARDPSRGFKGALRHFDDKLLRIVDFMKTNSGRKLALERTKRLESFVNWWRDEDSEFATV